MNIYLVGFMGTGKTSVGKVLAKELNMRFVEMDEVIEQREKRPITEIFAKDGEEAFRKIEKGLVAEISKEDNLVVSCGGGVVLDNENIKNLKSSGIMICLWAEPEVIYERTKDQFHRPLLNVKDPKKRIKELFNYRRPFYEVSDYSIDTSNLSIREVVDKIIKVIKNKKD